MKEKWDTLINEDIVWEDDWTDWKGTSLMLTSRHKLALLTPSNPLLQLLPHNSLTWYAEVLKLISLQLLNRKMKVSGTSLIVLLLLHEEFQWEILPPHPALPHTFLSHTVRCLPEPLPASHLNACQILPSARLSLMSSIQEALSFCAPDQPPPYVWSQHLIENWILVVACDDNEPFMSQFEKTFETPVFISNYR